MTSNIEQNGLAPQGAAKLNKAASESKWESFPSYAGLRRYRPTGTYHAWFVIKGRLKKSSLETTDKTIAIRKLNAKRDEFLKPASVIKAFKDGRALFDEETRDSVRLGALSRLYRDRCVSRILKFWPGLDDRLADTLTAEECKEFAKRLSKKYSAQFFNNCVHYFREIIGLCGVKRDDNPAYKIELVPVGRKQLELPTIEQFNAILAEIATAGANKANDRADFVRFLAFSGTRLNEASQVLWKDVDLVKNEIRVNSLKKRGGHCPVRYVPIVAAMRQLLERLYAVEPTPKPNDRVCRVVVCKKPLVRACARLNLAPLTHHSFRHLFATFCIESGIDIPTVSRWLGHQDGGVLAMKTYGHLRREHSQRMAQLVTFGALPALPPPLLPDLPAKLASLPAASAPVLA
jgi:integrase